MEVAAAQPPRAAPARAGAARLLNIVLPADNLFDLPPGTQGLSVGHGWVTLLHPLTPGTHTIVLNPGTPNSITTTIVVQLGG